MSPLQPHRIAVKKFKKGAHLAAELAFSRLAAPKASYRSETLHSLKDSGLQFGGNRWTREKPVAAAGKAGRLYRLNRRN